MKGGARNECEIALATVVAHHCGTERQDGPCIGSVQSERDGIFGNH